MWSISSRLAELLPLPPRSRCAAPFLFGHRRLFAHKRERSENHNLFLFENEPEAYGLFIYSKTIPHHYVVRCPVFDGRNGCFFSAINLWP